MGTWGPGLWQDDVAHDEIETFQQLLAAGRAPHEAVQAILESPPWGWADADDEVVQVLALAALALQYGVRVPALRDHTLALIESGAPLDRWVGATPEQRAARQEVLEHITALLERGTATAEELASVTNPEEFNLG